MPPGRITVAPRRGPVVTLLAVLIGALALLATRHGVAWTAYGAAVAALLSGKLALSLLPPRRYPDPPALAVGVVVPHFNEDPAMLRACLDSIARLDRRPDVVVVVDDGSPTRAGHEAAVDWARTYPGRAGVRRLDVNRGKREAMAVAWHWHAAETDVWVTLDSDTVLDPAALTQVLRPFADPRVAAATGTVLALNPRRSVLAALIDLRYVNAFLYERAAYSALGAVLCCCGSLAAYRSWIVERHLGGFLGQTFRGRRQVFGDDRHLTNLSLLHGRVVLARDAVARTAVPERFGHFLRQQTRWGKSFFRESLWALCHLGPRRVAWWLTLLEVATWAGFTVALLVALVLHPLAHGPLTLFDYAAWIAAAGYARSVHALSVRRPDWPRRNQVLVYLLAPLYGGIHLVLLLPLRVWSLLTLARAGWGTRARVEVRA